MHSPETAHPGVDKFGETYNLDLLRDLMRSEAAAVEAYDRGIGRSREPATIAALQRIREEHAEAAAVLGEQIRHFGGEPESPSGVLDRGPPEPDPLAGLQAREQTGITQYETALADPEIDTDCKDLIRYRLLPRCRTNVRDLNRLRT
jgi:hypothetical protein